MAKNIALFLSLIILFLTTDEALCKFDKKNPFLSEFEITNFTVITPRPIKHFEQYSFVEYQKNIRLKAFGKTFTLDLNVFYLRQDVDLDYFSKLLNSSGSYIDSQYFIYQGLVREVNDSSVLGFFTKEKSFRGYIITDDVYCVESYGEPGSVIVYKFDKVAFQGCTVTPEAGIDCSKTRYFKPWKGIKPPSQAFSYNLVYDKYLNEFNRLQSATTVDKKEEKGDTFQDSKKTFLAHQNNLEAVKLLNLLEDQLNKLRAILKGNTSTSNKHESRKEIDNHKNIKDDSNKHHERNGGKEEHKSKNVSKIDKGKHRDEKKGKEKNDQKNKNDTRVRGDDKEKKREEEVMEKKEKGKEEKEKGKEEKEKGKNEKEEKERGKNEKEEKEKGKKKEEKEKGKEEKEKGKEKEKEKVKEEKEKGKKEEKQKEKRKTNEKGKEEKEKDNDEIQDNQKGGKVSSTGKTKQRDHKDKKYHKEKDAENDSVIESGIYLHKNKRGIYHSEIEEKDDVFQTRETASHKIKERQYPIEDNGKASLLNEKYMHDDFNLFKKNRLTSGVRHDADLKHSIHMMDLQKDLGKVSQFNSSNVVNQIYDNMTHSAFWKDSSHEGSKEYKRHTVKREEKKGINKRVAEALKDETVAFQCMVRILVSPSYRKAFGDVDENIFKDILLQFALAEKILMKVPFRHKGAPFHITFSVSDIGMFEDQTYSPFRKDLDLEYFASKMQGDSDDCLQIGLVNDDLKSGELFDGYIPDGNGGVCALSGNTIIVSHGSKGTPAPMVVFFAALIRGLTKALGANDKDKECEQRLKPEDAYTYPNPIKILKDYILAKEIKPTAEYTIFSTCNIETIEQVLKSRACFQKIHQPHCGNAILDPGEECDCGPNYLCQKIDKCCNPMHDEDPKISKSESVPKGCTFIEGAQCSMLKQCCSECKFQTSQTKCVNGNGDCDIAMCDGKSAECPKGGGKVSDGLICKETEDPLVCQDNKCDYRLCKDSGLKPCSCAPGKGRDCVYCCLKDGKCQIAQHELKLFPGRNFTLPEGTECKGGACFDGECTDWSGKPVVNDFDISEKERLPERVPFPIDNSGNRFYLPPSYAIPVSSMALLLLLYHP